MGIINADELAKSYKLSLLKKIKAGDLHDDDLFQISSIRTNPKYFDTNAIDLDEFTKYIALKIGEHTGVEVTAYHDYGDKIATITVNNVPVDIYAEDLEMDTDYVAEQYDPDKAYAVGDYCMYNNKLYKCTTAIDESKWIALPQSITQSGRAVNWENRNATCWVAPIDKDGNNNYSIVVAYKGSTAVESPAFWVQWDGEHDCNNVYNDSAHYWTTSSAAAWTCSNFKGTYANVNAAMADFIADRSFDPTKWTEVTVTGEISNAQELPTVTSSDEGKVLTVNASGQWVAANLPDGSNTEY